MKLSRDTKINIVWVVVTVAVLALAVKVGRVAVRGSINPEPRHIITMYAGDQVVDVVEPDGVYEPSDACIVFYRTGKRDVFCGTFRYTREEKK